MKASGVGVFDELLEREVLSARRTGATVIFWDVDAPATLDRLESNPDDPLHDCVAQYDMVLTYGGGDAGGQRLSTCRRPRLHSRVQRS